MMQLHTYYRSSASYRVRIALNLKQLPYDAVPVHLTRQGGEQLSEVFNKINPQHLVPVLQDRDITLSQSLAIIEYLDELHPTQPLLPPDAAGRARVRELSLAIACDLHPLNNLRVLKYLSEHLGIDNQHKDEWYRHWVKLGFTALEHRLAHDHQSGAFCHGEQPSMADCCLVPQLYNARRFQCDLSSYPTILRIAQHCEMLNAFQQAHPDRQADSEAAAPK